MHNKQVADALSVVGSRALSLPLCFFSFFFYSPCKMHTILYIRLLIYMFMTTDASLVAEHYLSSCITAVYAYTRATAAVLIQRTPAF